MIPNLSLSAGGGGPSTATGGDIGGASNYYDFTSNNAFNVGGSGTTSQKATAASDGVTASGQTGSSGQTLGSALGRGSSISPMLIAGVIGGVILLLGVYYVASRKS